MKLLLPILDLLEVLSLLISENAKKVKEGDIVAFRNGRADVIDEHIRLEIDKFGKVTHEVSYMITFRMFLSVMST